jgi:cytochrome c-type biogenesis protein CcsB
MISTTIITYVTFGYFVCGILALLAAAIGKEKSPLKTAVPYVLLAVWLVHTGAIGLRWIESYQMGIGHAPLSNIYESLVFFGWAIGLALLFAHFRFRADIVVLLGLPILFLLMGSIFILVDRHIIDSQIRPLIPALQSNWLVIHVATCFLGYAGFAVSFLAAILLLIVGGSETLQRYFTDIKILDEIIYRSVLVGQPMLTLGIVTGAIWADYAWGSYWSWDPKETWSLITWLVYSAFLHARLTRGWSGHRTAVLSVIGFGAVIFTYFGVNYLPGLHSYF